jgi:hypothetical protein
MGPAKLRFTTDGDHKAFEMCNGEAPRKGAKNRSKPPSPYL